jgi:3-dehydroquinate dehydratase type II
MRNVLVLNGPNLDLLGTREPEIYGSTTLPELEARVRDWGRDLGLVVDVFQSNHEGVLIDRLHAARGVFDGVVFNPGALTHTSYALHDAISGVDIPTVETHISNIEEREPWRRHSVVRPACVATIYGRGIDGYRWGLRHLRFRAAMPFDTIRYGDPEDAVADIRVPDGTGPFPVAVLLHGGFWRHQWTRDTMDGLAVDLALRGFLTANVEYRRVGKDGGWPATLDDVLAAVDAVTSRTDADAGRVALVGHSAGGHLALLAADHLAARGAPPLAVSLGGITDLEAALDEDLGAGAAAGFLGEAPAEEASPIHRAPGSFPVVLVHGEDDDRVPVSHARAYARVAGDEAETIVVEGAGHFGVLDPDDPLWREAAAVIERRLRP